MGIAPVYVVSGGVGYTGEQVVRTVLAQFPAIEVPVITMPLVRQMHQIQEIVAQAAATGGTIVHTLADPKIHDALIQLTQERGVMAIDLMGPLIDHLSNTLGQKPLGQPDLYRQQHRSHFERIEAIDYTLKHDDGMHADGWSRADVLLTGVSRVGKTPTSTYLAVLGWKVANLPLIKEMQPPPELFQIDRRRVVGLTIDLSELVAHRRWRQRRFGHMLGGTAYADPLELSEELEAADRVFRRGGFRVVDVTQKPIETIASEVIALIPQRRSGES